MQNELVQDPLTAEEAALRETFDWMADRYVDQTVAVSRGHYPGWMNDVADVVAEFAPQSVADVGCGPGYLLSRLWERLPETDLLGVDYSPRMLEQVPSHLATECCSVKKWAEGAGDFDVVVMTFVLRDQDEPQQVLQLLRNRLKQNGHIVVLETQTPSGWRQPGFQWYFHRMMPWMGRTRLAPDWPGEAEYAPYQWLSESHRKWNRERPLPDAFAPSGYKTVRRHRPETDLVMLWSAERGD